VSGLFITFEGPDGAGKSSQVQLVAEYLESQQVSFLRTREPGGTKLSDLIRQIILDPEHQEMVEETEVLLYAASRAQHVREKIIPALEAGYIVLCDRFVDASVAYQGYGLGLGEDVIQSINHLATGGLTPIRTYMIDLAPELGKQRMQQRSSSEFTQSLDRIEQKELDYHRRVRAGFLQLAEKHERILLIDGNQPIHSIFEEIKADLEQLLRTRVGK